jgi:4-hydroxybenzoate polyprenyltransferase
VNTSSSTLLDYLRLFRLTNVFTAIADVTMGFLFVHHTLRPWPVFLSLAAASSLLYTAGMVLNDVGDVEQDRQERPHRPLPAGHIALASARRLVLLISALVALWPVCAGRQRPVWRSGPWQRCSRLLVLYDGGLKRTLAGRWGGPAGC